MNESSVGGLRVKRPDETPHHFSEVGIVPKEELPSPELGIV
jgi:hypothetical protein